MSNRAYYEKHGKCKAWCFTDYDLDTSKYDHKLIRYSIMCLEVCADTNRPHLQGFAYFLNAVRPVSCKQVSPTAHWSVAGASDLNDCISYCEKEEGEIFSFGEKPVFSQHERRKAGGEKNAEKWILAKEKAKGGNLDEIDPQIFVTFYGQLRTIRRDHMAKALDLPDGHQIGYWYYGKTGVGKTYAAINEFPDSYRKSAAHHWWDGYQGEDNVIIDDFDKYHVKQGYYLKIWVQRYAFIAEIKGSAQSIRPRSIVVTSNYRMEDIWDDEATLAPLRRRFKVVHFMNLHETLVADIHEEQRVAFNGVPNFIPPPVTVPWDLTPSCNSCSRSPCICLKSKSADLMQLADMLPLS